MNKRNILLVGRTGQGKSALANLLINKNDNFEEVFTESSSSTSATKNPQTETFEKDGITYNVIDTPSFSDTDLTSADKESEEKLLSKLAQIAASTNGVNQILFVVDGRFTEEEAKVIGGLRLTAFDEKIPDYLTIVRTRFPNFEDPTECQKDWASLVQESNEKNNLGSQIVKKLGRGKFIYLDNPPLKGKGATLAKETKQSARSKLLTHLEKYSTSYEPENLVSLNEKIRKSVSSIEEEKQKVQGEIENVKKEFEGLKERSAHNKAYDEIERNKRLINYTSQLNDLNFRWSNLEEQKKATTRSVFDAETIRWASEAGVKIGGDAFPFLLGKPVGGALGFAAGTGFSLLNGVVDLFRGPSESLLQTSNRSELAQIVELNRKLSNSQAIIISLITEKNNAEKERDSRPNTALTLAEIQAFQARPDITQARFNELNARPEITKDQLNALNARPTADQLAAMQAQRDSRPNITQKQWDDARTELNTYLTSLKTKLGLPQNSNLPSDWLNQLALQSDLTTAQNGLTVANTTIDNAKKHLGVNNLASLPNMNGLTLDQILANAADLKTANAVISAAQKTLGIPELKDVPSLPTGFTNVNDAYKAAGRAKKLENIIKGVSDEADTITAIGQPPQPPIE